MSEGAPEARRPSRAAWGVALVGVLACLGWAFPAAIAGRVAIDTSARLTQADALYERPASPLPKLRATDVSPEVAFQPWDAWIMGSWRRGSPPLWAPGMGFGTPLLANGQSAPLSPYKAVALGPSGGAWTTGFLLGRLAIAGAGMLALLAYLGLSPAAGAIGAIGFMLHAYFLTHLSFSDVHVFMAMPWLLLAAERLRRAPDRRGVAAFGLGIGLVAMLGHAEGALYTAAAAVAFLAAGAWADRWPVRRLGLVVAGAGAIGWLVAAVVVLPFAEFVLHSTSYLFGDRHGIASGTSLATRAVHAFTDLLRPSGPTTYFEYYVGVVPAVLAAIGLLAAGLSGARPGLRRQALALLGLGFASFLLCPPDNVGPTIKLAPNAYYVTPVMALGLALLAARGLDLAREAPKAAAVRAAGLGALALGLGLGLAGWARPEAVGDLGRAAPYLLGAGVVLLAHGVRAWPKLAVAAALLGLTAVDLGRMAADLVPPMPHFAYPAPPIVAHLAAQPGPTRVASRGALVPNTNLVHGVQAVNVMDAFLQRRYLGFYDAMTPPWDPRGYQADLLDVAGVRWLVIADHPLFAAYQKQVAKDPARFPARVRQARATLHENLGALPRARVLHAADVVPIDHKAAAARLKATPARWREVALVETPGGRPLEGLGTTPVPATRATITAYDDQHVAIATTLDRPGLLVLADAYYPGWVAEVDGVPAPIHPVDVAFRGVWLGPGTHQVAFHYRSPVVGAGFALTLLGLLLGLGLLRRPRRVYQTIQTGQPTGTIR